MFLEPFDEETRLLKIAAIQEPVLPSRLEQFHSPAGPRWADPWSQAAYLERYLREIGCVSFAAERQYVDRDFMDDYSAYYASNLFSPDNYCTRIHFFCADAEEVEEKLIALRETDPERLLELTDRRTELATACRRFSRAYYLGFVVIRPLPGSPIGRTVLRPYADRDKSKEFTRDFSCTRDYVTHVDGLALTVKGLAFQQQDLGVSACATTAIWSALHKIAEVEHIGLLTPARITSMASRYSLPHGRSMPSAGLSLDQMCQGIRAAGLAPTLLRTSNTGEGFSAVRAFLHSSILSGIPPILVLQAGENIRHAVTVAGMKVDENVEPAPISESWFDKSNELSGLYVHDDRYGPYQDADLIEEKGQAVLVLNVRSGAEKIVKERLPLTHIIFPLHPKIRLGFNTIREVAAEIAQHTTALLVAESAPDTRVTISTRISLAHKYLEALLLSSPRTVAQEVEIIAEETRLSRYIALVELGLSDGGRIDVVIDTTSSIRDIKPLAIIVRKSGSFAVSLAKLLGAVPRLKCSVFGLPDLD